MYCRECGTEIHDYADFCTNCGVRPLNSTNYCQSCGAQTTAAQEMCTKCGKRLNVIGRAAGSNDTPSGLLNLAVCCFPIIGLILYFLWKDEKPKTANSVCKWAIIGFILGIVLYIAGIALGVLSELMYY